MTIDNGYGQGDQTDDRRLHAQAHSLIAFEQSAMYAARLAITRWITTSSGTTTGTDAPTQARAAWYLQAQRDFQEWLGCGGFTQYDIAWADLAKPVIAGALDSDS